MQQSRTHESSKTLKIKIVYNSYTARRVSHHQPLLCKHIKLFWCYTLLESCFKYFMNVCTNSCLFFTQEHLLFFSVIQTHTFFAGTLAFFLLYKLIPFLPEHLPFFVIQTHTFFTGTLAFFLLSVSKPCLWK